MELVQRLIDQGHAINVRDHCGWLPIHEACNNGHLEIVKLLVNNGALINDRGGTSCDGVTPLYDAASNGHLAIVQFLLDKGASPVAKTDCGETALEILKIWKDNNPNLKDADLNLFNTIVERMSQALAKACDVSSNKETVNKRNANLPEILTATRRRSINNKNGQIGGMRRSIIVDDDSDECDNNEDTIIADLSPDSKSSTSTDEYRRVMESLRHRGVTEENSTQKKRKASRKLPALVDSCSSVNDNDWLYDDLGINSSSAKKRKTNSSSDLITTRTIRKTNSEKNLNKNRSFNMNKSDGDAIPDSFIEDIDFDETITSENVTKHVELNKSKRKIQTSLTRAGFESINRRKSDSAFLNPSTSSNSYTLTNKKQSKITNFTASQDKTSQQNNIELNTSQNQLLSIGTIPIDVRIEDCLYKVPIPAKEINNLTIKWLAEEAAKRYCR